MDGTNDLIERLLDHARLHDEQADFDDEQKAFAADLREAASVISAHRKICKEAHEALLSGSKDDFEVAEMLEDCVAYAALKAETRMREGD